MGKWIVLVFLKILLLFSRKTVAVSAEEDFFRNLLIQEPVDEAQCDQTQLDIAAADSATIIDEVPNLNGKWVSQDCEIRPGPEFLLRSYSFAKDNSFRLLQYVYEDESCFFPLYTVTARGRLVLKKPSWITPGGTESEFTLTRVTFIPHTTEASERLWRQIRNNCSELSHKTWKPHREYVIYNKRKPGKSSGNDLSSKAQAKKSKHKYIDCLSAAGVEFNELMLIRTQWRPVDKSKKNRELLLGDIHSRKDSRFTYKPTAFQVPLLKSDQAHGCFNCHLISKKNEKMFPQLLSKPVLPPLPHGQWVSQRCEVRPFGMFLTRKLSFDSRDRTWMGEYRFHSDPFCAESLLSVSASGRYTLGPFQGKEKMFRKRKTGTDFNFEIQEASLTLFDPTLRDIFNAEPSCGVGPWYVGIAKDLSPTFGCSILGIALPATEYELIKLEIDNKGTPLLLMGLPDTENKRSLSERPTSYRAPLVQCSVFPLQNLLSNQLKPISLGRRALHSSSPPSSFSTSSKISDLCYACIFVLFVSCLYH